MTEQFRYPWEADEKPKPEWNGVCACGKIAMDGVRCHLGATHEGLNKPFKFPWEVSQ